jgi:hypothetical protein
LARAPAPNCDGHRQAARAARVRDVVEECHADRVSVFVDSVGGSKLVPIVGVEVENLGSVGGTEGLGRDKGGVVDWSDGPLMVGRLVGWWSCGKDQLSVSECGFILRDLQVNG